MSRVPAAEPPPRTPWESLRRFGADWGFLAAVLIVPLVFHRVLLPFALALVLAYALSPLVARVASIRIARRTPPRYAAVIAVYVVMLSLLGLFFSLILPRLSGDVARLAAEAPRFFARARGEWAPRASAWLERNFPSDDVAEPALSGPPAPRKIAVVQVAPGRYEVSLDGLDLELEPLGARGSGHYAIGPRTEAAADKSGAVADLTANLARSAESEVSQLLKLGQRFIAGVVRSVATLVLMLMAAAFLLIDAGALLGFVRSLTPRAAHDAWDRLLPELDRGLAGVIRGQLMICLVNGVLTTAGLLLFRVKFALLLGVLAAGMSLIPVFGSILSSIPIVAVALASGQGGIDLKRGLAVLGWIIGIHLLEANVLNPKIIGGAARIHPLVVVFALLCGEETGGLAGALIAVPIASIVQTLFVFFRRAAEARAAAIESPPGGAPP